MTETQRIETDRGVPPSGEERPRRRIGWVLALAFTLGTLGFWIWSLFIYDPGLLVDELADTTFPTAAEEICASAVAQISLLPRAEATDDPIERADVLDSADAALASMLAELAPIAPTEPPETAEAVDEWLGDWATHLEDRQNYAAALRSDPDARFTESTKGNRQLSRAIDGFAQVNRMTSCETPGDVG